MSEYTATVIGLVAIIYFLYLWTRSLSGDSLWVVVMKYLGTGITLGLVLPVLSYLITVTESTGACPTSELACMAALTTFYNVYFWVFLLFIMFLAISFGFDVLKGIGGKK